MNKLSQKLLSDAYQEINRSVCVRGWHYRDPYDACGQIVKIETSQGLVAELIDNDDALHPEFKQSSMTMPYSSKLVKINLGKMKTLQRDDQLCTITCDKIGNVSFDGRLIDHVILLVGLSRDITLQPDDVLYIGNNILDGIWLQCAHNIDAIDVISRFEFKAPKSTIVTQSDDFLSSISISNFINNKDSKMKY